MFSLCALTISLVIGGVLSEVVFGALEAEPSHEGHGGRMVPDERWGWKPSVGSFRERTAEFEVAGHINSLYMNDAPYDPSADVFCTRVLVLGDSHTYAAGVSMEDTWAIRLEEKLNTSVLSPQFCVYNAAFIGYNLHQYLLRLIDQGPIVKPQYVVVGLSYATDLYDLLPPDRGGWFNGGDQARDYFDFDQSGQLIERHWSTPANNSAEPSERHSVSAVVTIRSLLERSATFRYLRRSKLALFLGSHITVGGQSLWPNIDVVVEREVSPRHQYNWQLFEALLLRIKEESQRQTAKLILVDIPYLPQVYDEIWGATFAGKPNASRTAAIERVHAWCEDNVVICIDTLDALREKHRELGRWVHWRKDAHPTPEGQDAIAQVIFDAALIQARP